jgi:hypothetical protein
MPVLGLMLCGMLAHQAGAQNRWDLPPERKPQQQPPVTNRKPGTRPRPRPRGTPVTPSLTKLALDWKLFKFTDDGLRKEVSIEGTYSPTDRLFLSVKPHQNGYLYIIRQPVADRDGHLLFPSKYYNSGRTYVRKDQEFFLPSDCASFAVPCWFNLSAPAAKDTITVIFSRDEIKELPNYVDPSSSVTSVKTEVVSRLQLAGLQLPQTKIPGVFSERYTITVTNTNAENNHQVIETLTFNKSGNTATAGPVLKN